MTKTHERSKFVLKSLDEIRDSGDVILQILPTDSKFQGNGKTVYLCEVVAPHIYQQDTQTVGKLASELVAAHEENRRLRRKIERLEASLKKSGGAAQ